MSNVGNLKGSSPTADAGGNASRPEERAIRALLKDGQAFPLDNSADCRSIRDHLISMSPASKKKLSQVLSALDKLGKPEKHGHHGTLQKLAEGIRKIKKEVPADLEASLDLLRSAALATQKAPESSPKGHEHSADKVEKPQSKAQSAPGLGLSPRPSPSLPSPARAQTLSLPQAPDLESLTEGTPKLRQRASQTSAWLAEGWVTGAFSKLSQLRSVEERMPKDLQELTLPDPKDPKDDIDSWLTELANESKSPAVKQLLERWDEEVTTVTLMSPEIRQDADKWREMMAENLQVFASGALDRLDECPRDDVGEFNSLLQAYLAAERAYAFFGVGEDKEAPTNSSPRQAIQTFGDASDLLRTEANALREKNSKVAAAINKKSVDPASQVWSREISTLLLEVPTPQRKELAKPLIEAQRAAHELASSKDTDRDRATLLCDFVDQLQAFTSLNDKGLWQPIGTALQQLSDNLVTSMAGSEKIFSDIVRTEVDSNDQMQPLFRDEATATKVFRQWANNQVGALVKASVDHSLGLMHGIQARTHALFALHTASAKNNAALLDMQREINMLHYTEFLSHTLAGLCTAFAAKQSQLKVLSEQLGKLIGASANIVVRAFLLERVGILRNKGNAHVGRGFGSLYERMEHRGKQRHELRLGLGDPPAPGARAKVGSLGFGKRRAKEPRCSLFSHSIAPPILLEAEGT